MGRITNIVNTSGNVNNRYTYDLLGRLIREDNKEVGTTTLFEYDTNGNMLKKSVADYSTGDTFTVKSEPSFTVSSNYADYIESYDGKAIETSSIGNITAVGTTSYSWTRAKLLSQVKKSDTDYVNYDYDGEGLRISKSHYNNGITTTHTYIRDGKKILVEKINNGTTEKVLNYLYLGENVIGFVYNNAYYHFQKNLQNDIIAIYNESGIKVAAYEYDAWGNHTITLDTNSIGSLNPFRYRGYYYDNEDNLYYCNARYYSPELCRWISPDSMEYLDSQSINGLNLYCYCKNNPIMYVDPSGHFTLLALGISLGFALLFEVIEDIKTDGKLGGDKDGWDYVGATVSGILGGMSGPAGFVLGIIGDLFDAAISGDLAEDGLGATLQNMVVSTFLSFGIESAVKGLFDFKQIRKLTSDIHANKKLVKSLGATFSFTKNGKSKKAFVDAIISTDWNRKKYTSQVFEEFGSSLYSLFF